jgi:hypothetical protein
MALQRAHLHWIELECHIAWCDERIAMHVRSDEQAKAAAKLCGIGPVTASALVATVDDFKQFKNGRQFSAWMGLVPRQSSSGGKSVLGEITKRGDEYLRTLLIQGAKSAVFTGAPTQRSPVAMDRPAARARRLAEGRGGLGQQARAHSLVDAGQRPELRSRTRSDQAPRCDRWPHCQRQAEATRLIVPGDVRIGDASHRSDRQQVNSKSGPSRPSWRRLRVNGALLSGWYLGPHPVKVHQGRL